MSAPVLPRSPEMRLFEPTTSPSRARAGSLPAPAMVPSDGERPTYWVETYGCEMNHYDAEFIASRFLEEGFAPAASPEAADVLLFNTCSVRQGAEDRIRARIENFAGRKRAKPGGVLGVVGCMAQRLGESLDVGKGLVDLVVGTDSYRELPELVRERLASPKGERIVATGIESNTTYAIERYASPASGPCAFLTIMQGCDKFCTFCIVPYTRGRERSKPATEVVAEAERLVARGARQITLLGQNVNSYRDGDVDFARLLRLVDRVEGLDRVYFTSSYPRDMTEDVFRAVAECRSGTAFLHFPVQSGSDRVLRRMKRRHTVEWYLRQIDLAREIIPDVQFSTDLIVGFPGESVADFQATLDLIERVRFAECFMYSFSPREGTPAAQLAEEISEDEKAARLQELIDRQRRIGHEVLARNLGRRMEVLVEGPSRRDPREPFGRTRNRFMVVLPPESAVPGECVEVELVQLNGSTFRGNPLNARESWSS